MKKGFYLVFEVPSEEVYILIVGLIIEKIYQNVERYTIQDLATDRRY